MGEDIAKRRKEAYKYVIVVLVYRNTTDIIDFIESVKKTLYNYKIIIVNSYYDDKSKVTFEEISEKYNCVFLNIENRGYSYGNNKGVRFAEENFEYDYIICSNPDIIIEKFYENILSAVPDAIYGPEITTKRGNKQNPMQVKRCKFVDYFIYKGYKNNRRSLVLTGIGVNKILREFYRLMYRIRRRNFDYVSQLHGSFLVFSRKSMECLNVPFDDKMFLFGEEGVLSFRSEEKGINMVYTTSIKVYHKEDGSMKLFSGSLDAEMKKSIIYFYENYVLHLKIK